MASHSLNSTWVVSTPLLAVAISGRRDPCPLFRGLLADFDVLFLDHTGVLSRSDDDVEHRREEQAENRDAQHS